MPQGGHTDVDSCLLTDLAPAQTTATGVLPSSVRSADMSMLTSPPLQCATEKTGMDTWTQTRRVAETAGAAVRLWWDLPDQPAYMLA